MRVRLIRECSTQSGKTFDKRPQISSRHCGENTAVFVKLGVLGYSGSDESGVKMKSGLGYCIHLSPSSSSITHPNLLTCLADTAHTILYFLTGVPLLAVSVINSLHCQFLDVGYDRIIETFC